MELAARAYSKIGIRRVWLSAYVGVVNYAGCLVTPVGERIVRVVHYAGRLVTPVGGRIMRVFLYAGCLVTPVGEKVVAFVAL